MISASEISLVGKVNKTHGINGELSVSFFDDKVMESLKQGACLIFSIDGIYVPFFIGSLRPRGAETLLITFDGEDKRESASAFVGKDVYMLKTDVSHDSNEDEGLYASALIGYEACTAEGKTIGNIVDIDDNTDNPLFVIEDADTAAKIYVPIVDDFISDIDTESRRIEFDLPEGLLDINS